MFIRSEFSAVMSATICAQNRCSFRLDLHSFVGGIMSLLLYLFLLTHEWCPSLYLHLFVGGILYYFICFCLCMSGVQHTLCCLFLFVLFCFVLHSSCVLYTQCCQFICNLYWISETFLFIFGQLCELQVRLSMEMS